MINPCVSSHPCSPDDTDAEMQDTPGLYPVCVVTRAMAKKQLTAMQNSQNEEAKGDVQSQPSVSSVTEGPPNLIDIFKPTWMDQRTILLGRVQCTSKGQGRLLLSESS